MLGSASPSRDCGNPEANAAGGMVLEVTISPSDAFMYGVAVVTTTTRGVLVAGRRSQTKISGTAQCGKPETVGKADAGDRAGHTMELGKGSCTWTTPLEMAGLKSKDGNSVSFVEATSTRSSGTGTFVGDMDNGDKFFVSFHDSTTIK